MLCAFTSAKAVELCLAVLFEGFADQFGRQPALHISQALDRVVAIRNLRLVLFLEKRLGQLLFQLCLGKWLCQLEVAPG